MVFSWLYKSSKRNTEQVILHKRTYKIQKDWELIRSATEIEREVDFVDDNDTNQDRKEYGSIEPYPEFEGGQIMETISDEISEEINQCNFTSSTPITPMALSNIIANEHELQSDHDDLQIDQQQIATNVISDNTKQREEEEEEKKAENKVFFKSIDEIIDDLKESESTATTTGNNAKKSKSSKCTKNKRKIVSYKSRRAKRFNNRRKARKTK